MRLLLQFFTLLMSSFAVFAHNVELYGAAINADKVVYFKDIQVGRARLLMLHILGKDAPAADRTRDDAPKSGAVVERLQKVSTEPVVAHAAEQIVPTRWRDVRMALALVGRGNKKETDEKLPVTSGGPADDLDGLPAQQQDSHRSTPIISDDRLQRHDESMHHERHEAAVMARKAMIEKLNYKKINFAECTNGINEWLEAIAHHKLYIASLEVFDQTQGKWLSVKPSYRYDATQSELVIDQPLPKHVMLYINVQTRERTGDRDVQKMYAWLIPYSPVLALYSGEGFQLPHKALPLYFCTIEYSSFDEFQKVVAGKGITIAKEIKDHHARYNHFICVPTKCKPEKSWQALGWAEYLSLMSVPCERVDGFTSYIIGLVPKHYSYPLMQYEAAGHKFIYYDLSQEAIKRAKGRDAASQGLTSPLVSTKKPVRAHSAGASTRR